MVLIIITVKNKVFYQQCSRVNKLLSVLVSWMLHEKYKLCEKSLLVLSPPLL